MIFQQDLNKNPRILLNHLLAAPFIYFQIIPLIFSDISTEIYHRICFPLYGLPYVKRGKYIKIDRHKLSYLTTFEKINCVYCGYGNGLLHYLSAIAGESEKYWCGIAHAKRAGFIPQEHQKDFLPYGDKKAFDEFVNK